MCINKPIWVEIPRCPHKRQAASWSGWDGKGMIQQVFVATTNKTTGIKLVLFHQKPRNSAISNFTNFVTQKSPDVHIKGRLLCGPDGLRREWSLTTTSLWVHLWKYHQQSSLGFCLDSLFFTYHGLGVIHQRYLCEWDFPGQRLFLMWTECRNGLCHKISTNAIAKTKPNCRL